jgi:hypothetical protein
MRKANSMGGVARGAIVSGRDLDGVVKQFIAIRPTMSSPPGPDWQLAQPVDDGGLWSGIDGRDGSDGADGKNGVDGRDGVDGVDGRGYTYRGTWNPRLSYAVNDTVTLDGSSYVAIAESSRREPDEFPKFWALMAKRGERGKPGESIVGPRGPGSGRLNQLEARVEQLEAGVQTTLAAIADENIIIGNAIRVTPTGVALATANDGEVVGLSASAANAGQPLAYLTEGQVSRADWTPITGAMSLVPNSTYYLSTLGKLSINPPSSGYVVRVATALDAQTLDIEVSQSVLL